MNGGLSGWAELRRERVRAGLEGCFADVEPEAFREALLYPLRTGGKRIRPLLVHAAAEALGGPAACTLPGVEAAALAVELLHTYSLVHDDLPAMDDDDERRGRPTVHRVYGEAVAILVGDALLTEALAIVAPWPRQVALLAAAGGARGMVGGQYRDIRNLGSDLPSLRALHAGKTGALIAAAVEMGGLAGAGGEVEPTVRGALRAYGEAVGLAFQVADDLLDAEQDQGDGGPPSFVRLLGEAGTRAEALRLADVAIGSVCDLPHPEALVALARFAVERSE